MSLLAKAGKGVAALLAAVSCVWALGVVARDIGGGPQPQAAQAVAPRLTPAPSSPPAPSATLAPPAPVSVTPAPATATSIGPAPTFPALPARSWTSQPGGPLPWPAEPIVLPPPVSTSDGPVPTSLPQQPPAPPIGEPGEPTAPPPTSPAPECDGPVGALLCTVLGLLGGAAWET
ncbi:MAG TPA: hypothetical protein VJ870_05075 [Amycolatopsis sp.]|nr:hypothetical protein [Amycolatopsis sp.]